MSRQCCEGKPPCAALDGRGAARRPDSSFVIQRYSNRVMIDSFSGTSHERFQFSC